MAGLRTRILRPSLVLALTCCLAMVSAAATKSRPKKTASPPQATSTTATAYSTRADVMQMADAIAERRGLDAQWVRRVIGDARHLPRIGRWVLPAATGTSKNWQVYRSRFIDPVRIQAGVAFWNTHAGTLERAEKQFGVPAEIIVGILGVETIYGRDTGDFRVVDALATLSFDFPAAHPRAAQRREFFLGELEQLLSLASRMGADPLVFKGSYAGAMGLPQFMPSSWVRYAIDFDGDGKVDLFNSASDAIGSVANYFVAHGWRNGMATHFETGGDSSGWDLEHLLAPDILPTFSTDTLAARGMVLEPVVRRYDGKLALVELQNGAQPATYVLGTDNFYAITRYNWSSYYAMAVIELGRDVARARRRP